MSLAVCAGWVGCANHDEPQVDRSDPEAVSQAFIRAVAAGDAEACGFLTPDAGAFVAEVGEESSCGQAIDAQTKYVDRTFFGSPPEDLADELDDGSLQLKGVEANFRFCTPDQSEVNVSLVEDQDKWLISSVVVGQTVSITEGQREDVAPCVPAPHRAGTG